MVILNESRLKKVFCVVYSFYLSNVLPSSDGMVDNNRFADELTEEVTTLFENGTSENNLAEVFF